MANTLDAAEILDRVFLDVRARLLEVAASLDRIDRAEDSVEDDPRLARIRRALELLQGRQPDRAEQIQRIFSLPYDEDWRESFALTGGSNPLR
jgi:hypothetical protein